MTRRRVVVTGLGCVSPVGNTVADAWSNLLAGQSGIGAITRFDASAIACRFAGEVKNFDLESYIGAKEARSFITGWQQPRKRFVTPVCPVAKP